jgi:hypothetical protein
VHHHKAIDMTPLCHLAEKYTTDKYSIHRYTPVYYDLFKDRKDSVKVLLEIGIGNNHKPFLRRHAASLFMWEEFFPNAKIVGLDINRNLMINRGRIATAYADQSEASTVRSAALKTAGDSIDIVIDDGSHDIVHQYTSAMALMPLVAPGGYYIIEDIRSEKLFEDLGKHFAYERIHTNKKVPTSLLCVIKC